MAVKQKLTVREAAKLHGVTPSAIYMAFARGDLTPDRRGKLVTVKRAELLAFRKRQREAMKPKKDPAKMTDAEFMQMLLDEDPDDW